MKQELTKQELHNLAMNIVGEELQKEGFEFLAINSDIKKNPQFVALKNKETYFIVVRPVFSEAATSDSQFVHMKPILEHAEKHKASVFYTGVWLGHGNDINQSVIKNEDYSFVYSGLTKINTTSIQNN